MQILEFLSKKLSTVARSTYSAEIQGLHSGTSNGTLLQGFVYETEYAPVANKTVLHEALENGRCPVRHFAAVDAKAVFTSITAKVTKPPTEKHLFYLVVAMRQRLARLGFHTLWWIDTRDMLTDALTKGTIPRHALLKFMNSNDWRLIGDAPVSFAVGKAERDAARLLADEDRL